MGSWRQMGSSTELSKNYWVSGNLFKEGKRADIPGLQQTKEISTVEMDARHQEALPGTAVLISTLGAHSNYLFID